VAEDGSTRVLFADEAIAGLNDLTADPDGDVIVGVLRFHPFAEEEPVPGEFVRIGDRATVLPGVIWTNGCAYSPDGTTFYGCDYQRGLVLAADRRDDGSYGPPRVVVETPGGAADGMAVDEDGGLWVALAARGTVGRFRPDGTLDSELDVPADFVASVCFGGDDLRELFITTLGDPESEEGSGAVFRTRAPVAGAPAPVARG
jgi:gluconolactonase